LSYISGGQANPAPSFDALSNNFLSVNHGYALSSGKIKRKESIDIIEMTDDDMIE